MGCAPSRISTRAKENAKSFSGENGTKLLHPRRHQVERKPVGTFVRLPSAQTQTRFGFVVSSCYDGCKLTKGAHKPTENPRQTRNSRAKPEEEKRKLHGSFPQCRAPPTEPSYLHENGALTPVPESFASRAPTRSCLRLSEGGGGGVENEETHRSAHQRFISLSPAGFLRHSLLPR